MAYEFIFLFRRWVKTKVVHNFELVTSESFYMGILLKTIKQLAASFDCFNCPSYLNSIIPSFVVCCELLLCVSELLSGNKIIMKSTLAEDS